MYKPAKRDLLRNILESTFFTWVLLGFLISYLLFFLRPIFLNTPVMRFPKYVPAGSSIGGDLKQMLSYSHAWLILHQTPYIGNNLYPPLATLLFTPLLIVKFSWAYKLITFVNVLCYILITLIIPMRMVKEGSISASLLLVIGTGLFSYGFQFELERGQFNIIAMTFCFLAICIYHSHVKYRYLAYALFTLSVQLKIYPIIFIIMLIKDWRDWKTNLKKFFALIAVNLALFFVLGPVIFLDFINSLKAQMINPYIWKGNHSIRSFILWASNIATQHGWTWPNKYSGWIQLALLVLVVVCIGLIMLQDYRRDVHDVNSYLLLACTLGAMLIPSVSHDYKLSILAAPIAILFHELSSTSKTSLPPRQKVVSIGLVFVLSLAYSSTLFSYTNKPLIVQNNFPTLLAMLLVIVCLSIISPHLHQETQA